LRIVESHDREMKEARMGHSARRLVLLGVATIGLLALARRGSKMHHKTAGAPQTAGTCLLLAETTISGPARARRY
jgi:hypothetical protein